MTDVDTSPATTDHRSTIRGVLSHPLIGRNVRPTILGSAYLGVVLAFVAGSRAARGVTVGGNPVETYTTSVPFVDPLLFDTVATVLIGVVTATVLVAPLVYAAWNGGPALSFAMPLAPLALVDLLAGRYALDLDWAIALTVGATAATIALYATGLRRTGSLRPWRVMPAGDTDCLLVVTTCCVAALVVVASFLLSAPDYVRSWYAPFGLLFVVPVWILGKYWSSRGRSVLRKKGWVDRESTTGSPVHDR